VADPAIRAEGLGKEYRIGQIERYKALRDVITDALYSPVRALRRSVLDETGDRKEAPRIWAVRDVSFEIAQGEIVGIVGANGAGKSTLLKILSRITEPTEGRALVSGRVGSLLEVGTGFHPELTGRDNVYLNGIILGMRRREIVDKFDAIVEFAGVEKFIDTPVKRYSSGMQVRLAFSVAAHLQPEILLVDEVLAVGDAQFQRKSLGRMEEVTQAGRTVVFVSHNMTAIRKLCPRTILMQGGRVVMDGPTDAVLARYLEASVDEEGNGSVSGTELEQRTRSHIFGEHKQYFRVREVALVDRSGVRRQAFRSDEEISVSVTYDVFERLSNLQVIVELTTEDGLVLLRSEVQDDAGSDHPYLSNPGTYAVRCHFAPNSFGERRFYLTTHFICQDIQHVVCERVLHFDVSFMGFNDNLSTHSRGGYFRPQLAWDSEQVAADSPAPASA
jgi:lipopolysaccharide transport system ATP-binding protein